MLKLALLGDSFGPSLDMYWKEVWMYWKCLLVLYVFVWSRRAPEIHVQSMNILLDGDFQGVYPPDYLSANNFFFFPEKPFVYNH